MLPPLCLGHPTAHPQGHSTHLHLQACSKAMKCCAAGAGWLQTPTCGRQGLATHTCPLFHDHVWGWGAGKGAPRCQQGLGGCHPALGLCRDPSPWAEQGLPPPLAARASRSLPALAVGAWRLAWHSRVLFKVQRVALQCWNKRCFCDTKSCFKSHWDEGRSGQSCCCLCQMHWRPLVCSARALRGTARSLLLSAVENPS